MDEHGLSSFVSMTGKCYVLECGDQKRLKIERLWWKPGIPVRGFFYEPGAWSVALANNDQPPFEWYPVDKYPVFCFTDASSWEVDSVDWMVGTTNIVNFLREWAWAGFDPETNENSYEEIATCYEESVERLLREVIGNCVPCRFSVYDLQNFLPTKKSRVESVRYHYASDAHTFPEAITVRNECGEEIELKLL